ncbi:MAG: DUF4012 domain-containing protein [Candidatus Magasanikbacteria bacterium]|nr:DUF4012 domain-containing protein [Candidatus Magasanikbacteria bacterium]
MFKKTRAKKILLITLAVIIAIILALVVVFFYVNNRINNLILNELISKEGATIMTQEDRDSFTRLLPILLGFGEEKTYLFLFLNNTELRPGGGFIGVYGVVTIDGGKVKIEKVEGSENLDHSAPSTPKPVPPKPLSDHLGVDRWWFRDSNWSPDFMESSKKTLELYMLEQGYKAGEIDGVIGVTPTVLEELLKIIGPISVDGMTFDSENVTRKLEYEVEYAYKDRDIAVEDRKVIVGIFMKELFKKMGLTAILNWQEYLDTAVKLSNEKQILIYARDDVLQDQIERLNWAGRVQDTSDDYVMWVDANLGALKTDHAIERIVKYSITPQEDGRFVANVNMEYTHNGSFDWRTSRYLSYVKVLVPKGSELVNVNRDGKKVGSSVDSGVELGKTWFGTFFKLEPGNISNLSFSYYLPNNIVEKINNGTYDLTIQRQSGADTYDLTFELNFDKKLSGASPAEKEEFWGDSLYQYETNLSVDRSVSVEF